MDRATLVRALSDKARILRRECIISTSEAGSGHPTSCLSAADLVSALFFHVMRYDPSNPHHPNNDRFVLSKGHAAPILYAAWAEAGAIPVEELRSLRRFQSPLEGHPTPRFSHAEVATGSLGQGLSIGAGMALAGEYLDHLDYRVYVLMGDGETAEGGIWEAAHFASYYKLDNLVGILDCNRLGQSQPTALQHDTETYRRRFESFGWHARVIDGHNPEEILDAFEEAAATKRRPTVIVARTFKGKGVSFLENKEGWHGRALKKGEEEQKALAELDGPVVSYDFELRRPALSPDSLPKELGAVAAPAYKLGEMVATREAYGAGLVKLGAASPALVALDGDVKNSTFAEKFLAKYPDRFFECFIAEQNMVGVAVGLAARGKIPFVSTFAAFLCRACDHIRMSAISRANVKYSGSHCGVSIGEDGPSQMALEDLAMMRAVPHAVVLYPSDAVSTERLVEQAARYRGVAYLRTTRPKSPVIYPNEEQFPVGGAKVLRSSSHDALTVVAAGVTLHEALTAHQELAAQGIHIRVLDAYSVKPIAAELLLQAAHETRNLLLTVEDHYAEGGLGDAVLEAVGPHGVKVHKLAVREVPISGKTEELLAAAGIDARAIVEKVRALR